MIQVGVLGVNHKLADVTLRETIAKTCQRHFGLGQSESCTDPIVLLSTCNRTELYFSSSHLAETHSALLQLLKDEIADEFEQKLYAFFGTDCFAHLASVTTGLDSAVLAETEIQGQVKSAYQIACNHFQLPSALHYLFQKALKVAKEVRATIPLQSNLPHMEDAIAQVVWEFKKSTPKVLFVGASQMNRRIVDFFTKKGNSELTICNRSSIDISDLIHHPHLDTLAWADLASRWYTFDVVILATKSLQFVLDYKSINTSFEGKKLLIDLSLPRNVNPLLAQDPRIHLLNIDQIQQMLQGRAQTVSQSITLAQGQIWERASQYALQFHRRQEQAHLRQTG